MTLKKRILIIAYYFPPLSGPGVQRPLKFVKYLPEFSWEVFVLTVKNPYWYYAHDPFLLQDVPSSVQIKRSVLIKVDIIGELFKRIGLRRLGYFFNKYCLLPDETIGWLPSSLVKAIQMIRTNNIRVVYTTSGPYSCHLIGYFISKLLNVRWIADFRDEWYDHPVLRHKYKNMEVHRILEKAVVKHCDCVMSAHPTITNNLKKRYYSINSNKFFTITNGYDEQDFKYINVQRTNNILKIVHVGRIYGFTGRTINVFLEAISQLILEGRIKRDQISLMFVGMDDISFSRKVFGNVIQCIGYVSHRKSIDYLCQSDVALLVLDGKRDIYPGKLFEYLRARRPILAIVPENGITAKLILKAKAGIVVDPKNIVEIKKSIIELIEIKRRGISNSLFDDNVVKNYERRYLTEKFATLLDRMISE
ncbi:MAG: glycosyltransferase [Deltaproteobacteria bacterium]|nr:glycosyltransferase [Deltaproteobacteria bacterium]